MQKIPIFFLTGACGSGKTTIIPELYRLCSLQLVLDLDALHPKLEDWNVIKQVWLQVAYQLLLNKRVTILCGLFLPWEFDLSEVKDCFTPYFIGLYCSDKVREERLAERGWSQERIQTQQQCNEWLLTHADKSFAPPMPLIDTTHASPTEVARQVAKIITTILQEWNGNRELRMIQHI